ncbi:TlpA family protein disulfide reductase [Flammeovirga kamogawensis]|uniref:TlpA family protein disulfide reductase n=1 Tax=Flammeovirga kamogawensis TaxID=373891 RepID=A0ABX8H1J9_9BACT|nr:TlpA disulfide reductase family protein [Flammeovirga kamogawensis]MBB6463787.1 thiol-disulfide isomerase/thioredoxin [Flammeovirga kamogawensis]QWG09705.1 TlpA family protein disulfide reductase [Flammeovirga kamogawensis]TRX65216.1 TlpA family protein disulfide reductase [Flammeovirga kamogawensis]
MTKKLLLVSISIILITLIGCKKTPLKLVADEYIPTSTQTVLKFNSFKNLEPLFKHEDDTVRIINFWATWCKPCVKELPYFEQANTYIKEHKLKAKIILVSLDMGEKNLVKYINKTKLTSEVIWLDDADANVWIEKVNPTWDGAIPVTLLLENGKQTFHSTDFESYEDLKSFIKL